MPTTNKIVMGIEAWLMEQVKKKVEARHPITSVNEIDKIMKTC